VTDSSPAPRRIRSYVRRAGRLTRAQARALETLWPTFGLETGSEPLNLSAAFGRDAPRILEIGFGDGECLAELAARHPERDYLGIEVHEPGVGHLLLALEKNGTGNVRIITRDATEVLPLIAPGALHGVHLFFPDPWPKKRHHKRRIVQPPFFDAVGRVVAAGGYLHMATDWEPYAEHMLAVGNAASGWRNASPDGGFADRPGTRPETKFERRGQRLGHAVRDLVFRRDVSSA
jgi:tRNA (guanine-N7-)-methyltransferase